MIGIALFSNSSNAISSDVFTVSVIEIKGGAPSDNCNARAPVILAFSNLVNVGGPILIFPFPVISISCGSCGSFTSIISLS